MDVLEKLFEEHFHQPVERIQALQGGAQRIGPQHPAPFRGKNQAVGILYGAREENVAFLSFSRHFRKHGLPVPEIYAEDLSQGAYLEEDLGDTTLFDLLSSNRYGETIAPEVIEAYRKVVAVLPRFQVEAGARPGLQRVLSARKLRSPVDRLGSKLFQILFSAARGHSVQRTGVGRRFWATDGFSADRAQRLFSLSRFSVPQHHAARRQALVCGLSGRPQRRAAI